MVGDGGAGFLFGGGWFVAVGYCVFRRPKKTLLPIYVHMNSGISAVQNKQLN